MVLLEYSVWCFSLSVSLHWSAIACAYTVVSCKYAAPAFLVQSLAEVFLSHAYPSHLLKKTHPEVEILRLSLGLLLLKSLPRMRTTRSNDGHASYFAEAPCFLNPCYLHRDVYSSSIFLHSQVQGLHGGMAVHKMKAASTELLIIFD